MRHCVDVATGTGQQAFAFAKRGYSVVGVDLMQSMLQIAGMHNKNGLVKFVNSDATQVPFEDCIFDVTCISFALLEKTGIQVIAERAVLFGAGKVYKAVNN